MDTSTRPGALKLEKLWGFEGVSFDEHRTDANREKELERRKIRNGLRRLGAKARRNEARDRKQPHPTRSLVCPIQRHESVTSLKVLSWSVCFGQARARHIEGRGTWMVRNRVPSWRRFCSFSFCRLQVPKVKHPYQINQSKVTTPKSGPLRWDNFVRPVWLCLIAFSGSGFPPTNLTMSFCLPQRIHNSTTDFDKTKQNHGLV